MGVDFTNYSISADGISLSPNPGMKTGFYVGGVNKISFCEKVSLQTELLYNYSGVRIAASEELATVVGEMIGYTDKLGKLSGSLALHTVAPSGGG